MKQLIIILIFLNVGLVQAQESLAQLQQIHDQRTAQSRAEFERARQKYETEMGRVKMFKKDLQEARVAKLEGEYKKAETKRIEAKLAVNKEMAAARKKASPQERKAFDQARANQIKRDVAVQNAIRNQPAVANQPRQTNVAIQYSQLPNTNATTRPQAGGVVQTQQSRNQAIKQNQSFGALTNNKNAAKAGALKIQAAQLEQTHTKNRIALANELVQKKDRLAQNSEVQRRLNQNSATTTKSLLAATQVSKSEKKAIAKIDAKIKKKSVAENKTYIKKKQKLDKQIKKADKKVQQDIAKQNKTKKKKSVKAKIKR